MKYLIIVALIQGFIIILLWCSRAEYKDTCEAYRKELTDTYVIAAQACMKLEDREKALSECVRRGRLRLVERRQEVLQ